MPTEQLSPAEQAIQQAHADRDAFLQQANDHFESAAQARTVAINPVAAALADAAVKAAVPATPEAKAAPETPAAPVIPGPPAKPAPTSPDATKGQESSADSPSQPSDTFDDVPSEDAFDRGAARPQTKDWRRLHAAKKHIEKTLSEQLQAARKEVEALKSQPAPQNGVVPQEIQQQLTELQKERESLLARLEVVAVEKSPRFEAQFKPRQEAAIMQAKAAVGPEKAKQIEELLEMPESAYRDQQIETLLGELPPMRSTKLAQAVADLDRLSAEKQQLSKRGSDIFKQWQAEDQQNARRQQQEREQAVKTTFESVVKEWKQAGAELDDSGVELARDVFMGQRDLKDIATAAMWVAVGPRAVATAQKLQKQLAEANAELGKLRSAQPGTSNDAGSKLNGEEDIPQGLSYADAIVQAALKAGLPLR